jgi:hypothetical protein
VLGILVRFLFDKFRDGTSRESLLICSTRVARHFAGRVVPILRTAKSMSRAEIDDRAE